MIPAVVSKVSDIYNTRALDKEIEAQLMTPSAINQCRDLLAEEITKEPKKKMKLAGITGRRCAGPAP